MSDLVVVGAGPAGVTAACRAAELGARTVLLTEGEFGGMAAHDGPVPVRVLAHAARLFREATNSDGTASVRENWRSITPTFWHVPAKSSMASATTRSCTGTWLN